MIADRMAHARKSAGLSLRALAALVPVSHTSLADYEKGFKVPHSLATVHAIADATGVDREWLAAGWQPPHIQHALGVLRALPPCDLAVVLAEVQK